ncbi:hypothetical protein RHGRI_000296 [Rhododendron griersonianum]|uniref:H(+)-exporting diphosphatase n=1 Tax=Rhododendron griersonianum TaxID=479676 RepID=A0AAV6LI93_9ERIC|nr:hypothetical protein RHGRI_000296 [Rhododendron griersonianum]
MSFEKHHSFWPGAVTSEFRGVQLDTYANAGTTLEARNGVGEAFIIVFTYRAVMGFLLAANGLLVLFIAINLFNMPASHQGFCLYHPDEDKNAEFYCDICEETRELVDSTYYCVECHFVSHVHCAFSELNTWDRFCFVHQEIHVFMEEWSLPFKLEEFKLDMSSNLSEKKANKQKGPALESVARVAHRVGPLHMTAPECGSLIFPLLCLQHHSFWLCAVSSEFRGVRLDTYANAGATFEARNGVGKAFIIVFTYGAVVGFLLAANGLFVLYIAINLFNMY